MTITSVGYNGTVDELDWASLSKLVGTDRGALVVTPTLNQDFRVRAAGTGTRPVTVAPGKIFGAGVMDTLDVDTVLNPAALSSGTRWDTVVVERNWTTNVSQLAIRTGTSSKQVTRANTAPGIHEDQPIALILLDATLSAVQQVIDLRAQSDKIRTYVSLDALNLLGPPFGHAYVIETGHRYYANGGAWLDLDAPVVGTIGLPSSVAASGVAPAIQKVNGVCIGRGSWVRSPTGLFAPGGGGADNAYSLGNIPPGFLPGVGRSFEAAFVHDSGSAGISVRIDITTAGIVTATVNGPTGSTGTSRIRADNICYPAEG